MDEHREVLIQKFLDGELARPERRVLLRLISQDPAVRQRLDADEALLDVAANLPRLEATPSFTARTLARLSEEPVPSPARAPERDETPRPWMRPVIAAATAAAIVFAVIGFWAGRTSALPPSAPTVAAANPDEVELLVRLVLMEPGAQSVALVGDFNGWDPTRTPLARRDGGVWTATLTLPPGRYHYMFLIDGQRWVSDPLAEETSLDGFGSRNSVLDVGRDAI